MAKIFFSYSHKDEAMRDQIDVHLSTLKREGAINAWHDRRIVAGEPLDKAIDENLETADVILCLISPDFIASDYCYSREMTRALERHKQGTARVIPVILRHCEWEKTPLGKLRATPRDGRPIAAWPDRDEALLDVARDVRKAVSEIGNTTATLPAAAPLNVGELTIVRPAARSANLHIKQTFSDLDRDTYIDDAFEFIAEYFATSLTELKKRHVNVDGRYNRIDRNRFTISLYEGGKKKSAMTVFRGGMLGHGRGIAFNLNDSGEISTSNGSFELREGAGGLEFDDLFHAFSGTQKEHRTKVDIADQLWDRLIEPLQR